MADDNEQPTLWTPGRIIATLVVALLIAAFGYVLFTAPHEDKAVSRVVLPGAPISNPESKMPADFDVRTIDDRTIKLSAYRGKVLVVDFWATWCGPCQLETPQLTRLSKENRDRGLEVIGLHIDDRGKSSPEDIRKFIDHYGVTYTVGFATNDMFNSYLGSEDPQTREMVVIDDTIPQTLVFGRDGRLVKHLIGYSPAHGKELDEAVNRALAGS